MYLLIVLRLLNFPYLEEKRWLICESIDPYPNAFNMGEILQAKTGFLFGEIGSLIRAGTQYVICSDIYVF